MLTDVPAPWRNGNASLPSPRHLFHGVFTGKMTCLQRVHPGTWRRRMLTNVPALIPSTTMRRGKVLRRGNRRLVEVTTLSKAEMPVAEMSRQEISVAEMSRQEISVAEMNRLELNMAELNRLLTQRKSCGSQGAADMSTAAALDRLLMQHMGYLDAIRSPATSPPKSPPSITTSFQRTHTALNSSVDTHNL